MKVKVVKKNLINFLKENKWAIAAFALDIVIIGGVMYVVYKKGWADGVHDNTLVEYGHCVAKGYVDGDYYNLSLVGPTYGCGDIEHGIAWLKEDAIIAAKGILKDLGCLKEIVEIPEEIAKEVVANG